MRVTILQGSTTGTPVYVETHSTTTNENGLLTIQIGGGTIVSGTYENGIFWAGGPSFIKTEIDPLGGTAYTITSTSELLSVPYSNYAHVSGILAGWSADFVGAYKYSGLGGSFVYSIFITYLGFDKVALKILFATGNGPTEDYTFLASLLGNNLTILEENNMGISGLGVKNNNSLILDLNYPGGWLEGYDNSVTFNFDVIKM
jgi:hypothetical protein